MVFREYRHRLPHWRDENATYFITWRLSRHQSKLNTEERPIVLNALTYFDGERYELMASVVMDDHVHVICRPFENCELEDIVHSWKSYTSKEIHKGRVSSGALWQDEYFDRIIRDEKELGEKLAYIQNNPYRRWPEIERYEWVWFSGDQG